MKHYLLFSLLAVGISCASFDHPSSKRVVLTQYKFLKDSNDIFSILPRNNSRTGAPINYRDFVGKLIRVTIKNNSHEPLYFNVPMQENMPREMIGKFTASVQLLQPTVDLPKRLLLIERGAVDNYDSYYDTLLPNRSMSKIALIDNNQTGSHLNLLISYRGDSSFYRDTLKINNIERLGISILNANTYSF